MPSPRLSPRTRKSKSVFQCVKALFLLLKPQDFCVSVENTPLWRMHQTLAVKDGEALKSLIVGRLTSNMVFMSLLLSMTVGIVFSPSNVVTTLRDNLKSTNPESVLQKVIGHMMLISIFLSLFALMSNFAAWMIIQSVSRSNIHAIVRSTLGLVATYLPGMLVFASINLVMLYLLLWVSVLIPNNGSGIVYLVFVLSLYIVLIAVYSSLGRLMMNTSSMDDKQVLNNDAIYAMYSFQIQNELLEKNQKYKGVNKSIRVQYTPEKVPSKIHETGGTFDEESPAAISVIGAGLISPGVAQDQPRLQLPLHTIGEEQA